MLFPTAGLPWWDGGWTNAAEPFPPFRFWAIRTGIPSDQFGRDPYTFINDTRPKDRGA